MSCPSTRTLRARQRPPGVTTDVHDLHSSPASSTSSASGSSGSSTATASPLIPEDPSEYFDAAADAFLSLHLVSALRLGARLVYHAAAIALGLRIAKWYFDRTLVLSEQRFVYLVLSAVGAVPFVLAVPMYGLVVSYAARRGLRLLTRSVASIPRPSPSSSPADSSASSSPDSSPISQPPAQTPAPAQAPAHTRPRPDLTIPLLVTLALLLFALLYQSSTPPPPQTPWTPNPFPQSPVLPHSQPQALLDPTALRYELHADVHHTVQLHLADLRRELVAQSQCHAKMVAELKEQVAKLRGELETLQNRSIAGSLQNAVDACSVAKVAELAAAALTWVRR